MASKSNIAAQIFFFSCDAPDTTETSKEIHRLAKIIDDVFSEQDVKWKVVNHSLNTDRIAALREAGEKMAEQLRAFKETADNEGWWDGHGNILVTFNKDMLWNDLDAAALEAWEAANK